MRFYPPFQSCDHGVCINMADSEIIQEDLSGVQVLKARACELHTRDLFELIMGAYLDAPTTPTVRGFFTQRYVPRG